jgi:catalase
MLTILNREQTFKKFEMSKKHSVSQSIYLRLRGLGSKIHLWFFSVFFVWVIVLTVSLFRRKRMSHDNGIGASGKITIEKDQDFPPHEFFVPGKIFPARIRHASATFLDDAMNCIRSMSIKFSDHHFKSEFDIEMNTGEISLFWSAWSFYQFAKMRQEKYGVEYIKYYKKYPEGLTGAELALRRNPNSFQDLRYFAKTPYRFEGSDSIKRYAKYRVIPFEDIPETGIINDPSTVDTGNQRIFPHETRGRNYLKEEYEQRVAKSGAKYRLQIQTRVAQDDDDPELFNNMKPWDERAHPWHNLAVIDIDKTLDWKESTMTSFSLKNMPKTLGFIPAKSIYDYNSLNYLRAHSERARKARLLSYKIFGFPNEIPNNEDRNSGDWNKIQREKVSKLTR